MYHKHGHVIGRKVFRKSFKDFLEECVNQLSRIKVTY